MDLGTGCRTLCELILALSAVFLENLQNSDLGSHLWRREPLWKYNFPEKLQHSFREEGGKTKFGQSGVGKRSSSVLLASSLP